MGQGGEGVLVVGGGVGGWMVYHKNTKAEVKTNDTGSRCTENTTVSSGQRTQGDSVFAIKGAFFFFFFNKTLFKDCKIYIHFVYE